jgi:hypothetical protein
MSRTINTMPYPIQKEKREPWRNECGYPGAYGGSWPGRKEWARIRNRKYRRAATVAIAMGKDFPVKEPRNVAYDVW